MSLAIPRRFCHRLISQHIRFARAYSSVEDFHIRNRTITEKLLKYRSMLNKLRKTSRNYITKIVLLLASRYVTWNLFPATRYFTSRVLWWRELQTSIDTLACTFKKKTFSQTHKFIPQNKLIPLYDWSTNPLHSIATFISLVVRWQTGFSTTWWCIFKP